MATTEYDDIVLAVGAMFCKLGRGYETPNDAIIAFKIGDRVRLKKFYPWSDDHATKQARIGTPATVIHVIGEEKSPQCRANYAIEFDKVGRSQPRFEQVSGAGLELTSTPITDEMMPCPGSKWQNHNGGKYTVLYIVSKEVNPVYPLSVVYQGANGRVWIHDADYWHRGMKEI